MKRLKFFSTLMSLMLLSQSFFAQSTQRTLVKSFNVQNLDLVTFDIDGQIEIQEWDQPMLRVQMEIKLENGSDKVLRGLIAAKRFDLDSERINGELKIFSDKLAKNVTFRGEEISENVKFVIKAPRGLVVNYPESVAVGFVPVEKE